MAVNDSPAFLGRTNERESLDRLLENVREGRSGVVVIRGEAGLGKTALLRHAVSEASGFKVAEIAGVEAEMELPFAGLHQLCAPMLSQIDMLPEPQRDALSIAFGLSSGEAPDAFLVALAALSLLAHTAEERPLLCVVDDAQWLDVASAQILGFVARRLLAEQIAMIFAVREPSDEHELVGLPELRLAGLDDEAAHALLASVVSGRLDASVSDRIVAESRGNPLALLELSRGTAAADLAGGFALPDAVSVPAQIEERYRQRVDQFPATTRQLMLLAAADPVGDAALLWRAAAILGLGLESAEPAAEAELLEIGAQVRFRHPLVRSAAYRSAPPAARRAVHGALAAATDPDADPDRRAWHLAHAATAPDEAVATELIDCAGRAQRRGGVAAAAAFLERSVTFTVDPRERVSRALTAARAKFEAGIRPEALPHIPLRLAAWRGEAATVSNLLDVMRRGARERGEGGAIAAADYSAAILHNGLGQYELAFDAAENAAAPDDPVISSWALYELIEAASRSGQHAVARNAMDRLGGRTRASGTAWARGIEARSRALVGDGEAVEALYREAIEWLGRTRMAAYLARARLTYGEWLRRDGRRVEAREQLRHAYGTFFSMGADGFADRAKRELQATGEKVRKRQVDARDELTPQQLRVAQLARDGRTNSEIAAELFLSPRTVEWHLRQAFSKLGIRSRIQLHGALPSREGEATPV